MVERYKEKLASSDNQNSQIVVAKPKPLHIKTPKMEQDGKMGMKFSKKVFLPDFLTDGGSSTRRRLISFSEINVQRDVMEVNLVINSDVNPTDIKYFLSITEWTEDGISILMNVTTPLLISKGT